MTTARIRPFAGLCQFRIGIGQDPFRFDHVTARRAPRLTGTSTSMVCAANMTMRVQAGCGQSALVRPSWCHTRLPQGCVRQANAQLQYLGSCYYCECYPHPAMHATRRQGARSGTSARVAVSRTTTQRPGADSEQRACGPVAPQQRQRPPRRKRMRQRPPKTLLRRVPSRTLRTRRPSRTSSRSAERCPRCGQGS